MSGAIIPILDRAIGAEVNSVNARDLHAFLENGDHFATWIRIRIGQYGFVEGRDFETFSAPTEKGRPRCEYVVSLDMAKELAMVERNDKGREARAYFLACERRAKGALDPAAVLNDPAAMRGLLLSYTEKVIALEGQVADAAPKVEVYDRVIAAGSTHGLREAHKMVREATGVTEREMVATMRRRGWVQRLGKSLQPAHYGETRGYVTSRMSEWTDADGVTHTKPQLRLTPKGIARLVRILTDEAVA